MMQRINSNNGVGASLPSIPYHYETITTRSLPSGGRKNKGNKFDSNNSDKFYDNKRETQMDKLIRDIRVKIKESLNFWNNLPYQVCNTDDISDNDNNCWDGNLKE